jgi:hypothetical protein
VSRLVRYVVECDGVFVLELCGAVEAVFWEAGGVETEAGESGLDGEGFVKVEVLVGRCGDVAPFFEVGLE